jgi:tripartite-type tricarboxylate transporter receptor subunit TctC
MHSPYRKTIYRDRNMRGFSRRSVLAQAWPAAVVSAVLLGTPSAARAQGADTYPNKPIRLIVSFAPGGPTDIMARIVGKVLSDKFGQPVVIENRAGAGGNIGTEAALRAAPDGYTLGFVAVSSVAIAPTLTPKPPYDVLKDLAPIALAAITKGAVVAHPSAPFNDLKGLIADAKANPDKLTFGTSGVGTSSHLASEAL